MVLYVAIFYSWYITLVNYCSSVSFNQGLFEKFPVDTPSLLELKSMEWIRENGVNGLTKFLG